MKKILLIALLTLPTMLSAMQPFQDKDFEFEVKVFEEAIKVMK